MVEQPKNLDEIKKSEEDRIAGLGKKYIDDVQVERDRIEPMIDKLTDYDLVNEIGSEAEKKVKEAESRSWIDELTKLKNVRAFNAETPRIIGTEIRTDRNCSMIIIDIDDFKKINDTFGHSAGDQVLEQISRKIEGILRKEDFLCRMGGDEFVALLMDTDPAKITPGLEKMREAIRQTDFKIMDNLGKEHVIKVKASIGCSHLNQVDEVKNFATREEKITVTSDDLAKIVEKMKKYSDMAMYESKKYGKDGISIYNPANGNKNEN
jgi:diguanylate cyclase (GGDEF)-like protein